MLDNSSLTLHLPSHTLTASYTSSTLRLLLQPKNHPQTIFMSHPYNNDNFPSQLQHIFQTPKQLYEYLHKLSNKNGAFMVQVRNGLLVIRVNIADKMKQIPIRMRKMRQQKQRDGNSTWGSTKKQQFLLTSIASQPSQSRVSLKSQKIDNYPAPRLKLMLLKDKNKANKALSRIPHHSTVITQQSVNPSPSRGKQTSYNNRYGNINPSRIRPIMARHSYSQGKTKFNRTKINALQRQVKEGSLDLSNQEIGMNQIKQIVNLDIRKLTILNLGYNNIGDIGLQILTSIIWPSLTTLYICFDNITKMDWQPSHLQILQTLSLSGNRIKEIPKNISQLIYLRQLFAYNNRLQSLPEEILTLSQLRNLSVYGNRFEANRMKRLFNKLKNNKVQVWQ